MNIQLDNVLKRTRGYWFVDGFTEIIAGVLFVILSGIMMIRVYAYEASFSDWFLSVTKEIVFAKFLGGFAAILVLWWLKDHFTFPRTGYIRSNQISISQILILIRNLFLFILLPLFGLLGISFFIATRSSVLSSMPVWFPIGVGLIWTILLILCGEWMGLRRFRYLGIAVLFLGAGMGIWQFAIGLPVLTENTHIDISNPIVLEIINRCLTGLSFLIMTTGIALLISGLVTFLRYRNENPAPYTEER